MSDFTPFSVHKYNSDSLIDFIRYKTNWDHRREVSEKKQLKYLFEYLSSDHINAKTVLIESNYVDRHYLEDYSEYYARCFNSYPRSCARIHFFSSSFNQEGFLTDLENNTNEVLQNKYIGFIVIRPIPHTFLSRVCLKPYDALTNYPYKIITKSNIVSLFGIQLTVDTVAFQEQDKVVSACATSAIWMLLNAVKDLDTKKLPSPSAIT